MKYLLMIWSNPQTWGHPIFLRTPEAAAMSDDERAGMLRDFEELMGEISESGELVTAQALADPLTARSVRVLDGESLVTDGPSTSSKEQMAGYFVVDCATPERAEEIARRFPDARFAAVEVRPLMGGSAEDL
ncbi:YciI family protein [Terracoccus sp. 273MFTsu3.1]|uniref:YciI family protein n=1 Tax=Terracoccus sp. 273MFTsu3.1 TaxID=1172188 RepID=UPI00036181A8|nr:YciI family protein [Terracoccus sp. 273MFTsu3.1]